MEVGKTEQYRPEGQATSDMHQAEVVGISADKKRKSPLGFLWRHKVVVAVILAVLVILLVIFTVIPVVPVGGVRFVNLNTTVKIEKNQVAVLKYTSASVKLVNLSNMSCPAGQTCYGSGSTVEYQLSVAGKNYATGNRVKAAGAKYQVQTVETDYKTYANVKIVKTNEN